MKFIPALAILLVSAALICACAAKVAGPPHGLSMKVYPMPAAPPMLPVATFQSVEANVAALQPTIGRYPPRFESEEQRDEIYTRWSTTLIKARSLDTRGDKLEVKLFLLSELYRQGHNLDVRGAAPEALDTIERCIDLYTRSRPCHLSASYFYLSAAGTPSRLERAERSLTVLRELAAPGLDDDAEAGFIWLALYRENGAEASRLIDRYLAVFPQSTRAEMFRKIQSGSRVTLMTWTGP